MQDPTENEFSEPGEPGPILRQTPPRSIFSEARPAPQSNGGGEGVPELHSPRESAFRVIELRVDADGGVHARVKFVLTEKIYRQITAVRYAEYRAKEGGRDEFVYVVLNGSGRAVAVIAAGTGRRVSPGLASKARRLVRQHLPDLAPKKRRVGAAPRRTSRPGISSIAGGKRRSSRAPVKKKRR
jgi:hypothetical protein